ncbi:MAG: ribbon-helix-helix domain-containing protein [Candidatus Altiarchaeota archaeon]|nr:ribbon-helix-helix domain-containing protein [Candidatus Altiarchaeota archaeon]
MTYKQISLKLPEEILDRVDMVAKSRYKKRSEVIREAVLAYISLYKQKSIEKEGDALLRKWMNKVVDIGPTNAAREHDLIF